MAYYDVNGVLQEGDHQQYLAQRRSAWDAAVKEKQSGAWRRKALRTVAGGAALFGGGAALSSLLAPAASAGLAGGGAVAGPVASGAGASVAGTTGGGMTLGRIFGSRGFEAGANALTSLLGMRSQNRANRYATDANSRIMADQTRLEQERIRRQEEADAADRADIERRWVAEQAQKAQEYAALQEEREYNRSISDRQLRLDDEREARRAVYRPYGVRAMRSLGSILGIGG